MILVVRAIILATYVVLLVGPAVMAQLAGASGVIFVILGTVFGAVAVVVYPKAQQDWR